ncbi:MAG: hypothetical protein H0X29_09745 [Parachlamydiaceae bacterium]|nr:hypothetical protein [Parachlamydiaceae bacterium]
MSSYLIFFIVFLFSSVSCSYIPIEIREKILLIDALEKNINSLKYIKIFKINTCGKDDSGSFKLFFYSYQQVNVEEARLVIIECVEKLYDYMDSQQELITVLTKPEISDIEFTIMFIKKNGTFVEDSYLSKIFLCNGSIYYDTYNLTIGLLTTIHSESYNEALDIVQQQKKINAIPAARGL